MITIWEVVDGDGRRAMTSLDFCQCKDLSELIEGSRILKHTFRVESSETTEEIELKKKDVDFIGEIFLGEREVSETVDEKNKLSISRSELCLRHGSFRLSGPVDEISILKHARRK